VFEKAREWLEWSWWGIGVCYVVLIAAFYGILWAAIEPLGIPDTFEKLTSLSQWRAFYHIILAVLLASHVTLLFDIVIRKWEWGRRTSDYKTTSQVLRVGITSSLIEWHKEGAWTADLSHDPPDLRVTDSDRGGILRRTEFWTDYEFEFETKIDNANTSWIIRGYDLDNYVMLQCWPDRIVPHYRRNGLWWREREITLPRVLPEGWFKVCIRVEWENVEACLQEGGKSTVLFADDLLGPRTASLIACRPSEDRPDYVDGEVFLSYLRGGVGFRACGHESAHFRNITVRRIVED
jgi:hypothetical protein